jgi:phage baseplate assembly protein W
MTFLVPPTQYQQLPIQEELAFPFTVFATGEVGYELSPVQWAENHILAILLTNPGERVMRPDYGVGLLALLFENLDPVVLGLKVTEIQNQVALFEPEITITNTDILGTDPLNGIVTIQISFRFLNSINNVVTYNLSSQGLVT